MIKYVTINQILIIRDFELHNINNKVLRGIQMFHKKALFTRNNKLSADALEREFARRGPWVTQFIFDGKPYGGSYRVWQDVRPNQFFASFPDVRSILDLGSLEGGQTFQLAMKPGVQVTGVEARRENIDRALFVQKILGINNVKFVQGNLESMDLMKLGKYDAVFCSGLLYHLPEPWDMIRRISEIAPKLFIWTHYAADDKANEIRHGYKCWVYPDGGLTDPLAGLSSSSYWLTLDCLQEVLRKYDFKSIYIIKVDTEHENGPCVTLAATKG